MSEQHMDPVVEASRSASAALHTVRRSGSIKQALHAVALLALVALGVSGIVQGASQGATITRLTSKSAEQTHVEQVLQGDVQRLAKTDETLSTALRSALAAARQEQTAKFFVREVEALCQATHARCARVP
jgi:uncharacterized protein HemX